MKRTITSFIMTILILQAGAAMAGDVFQVHGLSNCNASANGANGVERTLAAGTHYFTLSGAISNWSSNNQNGGLTWVTIVYVYDMSTGESQPFWSETWYKATPTAAAADVAGTVFEFELATETTVRFVTIDTGGCGDNRGAVTVDLDDQAVSIENSSWSLLKTTYR